MDRKKIIQAVIFFIVGIALFWWVFKDTDIEKLRIQIGKFNPWWLFVSVLINILSQWIRAHRWNLLFKPLKYTPNIFSLFFATLILNFVNLIIPRGGEFARLGVVNRKENIPFSKLLGITMAERLTDLCILLFLVIVLITWQFDTILELLELPEIGLPKFDQLQTYLIFAGCIVLIVLLFFAFKHLNVFKKLRKKLHDVKQDFSEGFSSLRRINNKFLFFSESFLIYSLWLFALYVLFFAYPPTQHLTFSDAAFTFGLATLAFLLPVQAGMGAWHFIAIQSLMILNIDPEQGRAFSLVAHATTNYIHLFLGVIAFALLPLINNTNKR